MIAATASRDPRCLHACLTVSLLICAYSARAEEPVRARVTDQDYEPVWRSIEAELQAIPPSVRAQLGAQTGTTPIVESTGFEEEDGWVPGWICGPEFAEVCVDGPYVSPPAEQTCGIENPNPQGWGMRANAQSCIEPHVDTVNPFEGGQHLRFARDPLRTNNCCGFTGCTSLCISAFSPVTGPHPIGPTTVSVEIAGSFTFGSGLIFIAHQPLTGGFTGVFRFGYYGTILMYDNINGGYRDTGVYWSTGGTYTNATIEIDPCNGTLKYFYGGDLIFQRAMGGAFIGNTVESVLFGTDNYTGPWDFDNFLVIRGDPCPYECGNELIDLGSVEECEPTIDTDCPGRCVPPGEEGECTCVRPSPTCEEAQELPVGTITEITHGGWFTFVAEAPATAIETCGSTGYNSSLSVYTGACGSLDLLETNDVCNVDSRNSGASSDPLASCHPVTLSPWEACTCIDTTPGKRYWVQDLQADKLGAEIVITRSNRLTCDALWDSGACCDRLTGDCVDDVAEFDCAGPDQGWFAQQVCEAVFCRTTAIPTVSDWGLVILTLLGLTIGSVVFRGKQSGSTSADAAGAP